MKSSIEVGGQIDRDSPVPYYHQLKELIRNEITSGRWKSGSRIPSEPQLCESLDVSRTVVRQALKELENEKLLRRHKGRGTFVSEPKISGRLVQTLIGFHDDMLAQGLSPKTRVIEQIIVPASEPVAEHLGVPPHSKVLLIERVRSVNGNPIVLVRTYLPYLLCRELEHYDLNDKSLYEAMARVCGLEISHGRRMLEAVSASKGDAQHLDVSEGDPLLYLRSITYLENGRPVEYYEAKHRGDRTILEVELVRTKQDDFPGCLTDNLRPPAARGS